MPEMSKKIYFKYFFRRNCVKCSAQKTQETLKILGDRNFIIEMHDCDELDGLSEASYYSVWSFPTLVLAMEYENGSHGETMLGRWVGILDINKVDEILKEQNVVIEKKEDQ